MNSQGRDTLTYVRPSMQDSDKEAEEEESGQIEGASAPDASLSTLPKRPEEQPKENADVKTVPAHHRAVDHRTTYEPQPPAGTETVDITTFKPVFVPRAEREMQKASDKRDGRGKDKKRRARAIVSFGEDEGTALVIAPQTDKDEDKARKKKPRTEKEKGNAEGESTGKGEDVEMWVEKEPPQVVARFNGASSPEKEVRIGEPDPPPTESARVQAAEGPSRGRKRAIDFL